MIWTRKPKVLSTYEVGHTLATRSKIPGQSPGHDPTRHAVKRGEGRDPFGQYQAACTRAVIVKVTGEAWDPSHKDACSRCCARTPVDR